MQVGFRWLILAAVWAACSVDVRAAEPQLLPQKLLDAGWISLFDGETLYGWEKVGDAEWTIVDGEIRTDGDKPGWLMTTTEWADFDLEVEFKASASTNSGIFVRTTLEPTDPTKDCYEVNIAPPDNPFPTGSLVGRRKAVDREPEITKPEVWHKLHMDFDESRIEIWLDGKSVVMKYRSTGVPVRGRIALQSKEGPVAFRNIRLSPRGLRRMLGPGDMSAWTTAGAESSKFEVNGRGELHLTNGPGQIATLEQFRDFVMQLDCKVKGEGLNSGVFFRTLPSGRWQGYESQINHKFKDADRTKPADFGTGGIYRRQPARRVVADDHEWFTKTIVAEGPHFAVWVNGYQVSDWTDTRPEKENPREGLRLGPGVIAIQGHDPTTDFLFRDVRIGELPE